MIEVPVFARRALEPGMTLPGPAIVVEDDTTIVVPHTFTAEVDGHGYLIMQPSALEPAS